MSITPRLNRIFGADGKCFEVALDHGIHNEPSFLSGMENLKQVVRTVAAGGPDAMLLSLGQAHWLQDLPGKNKPALVMRADPTNLYNVPTPSYAFCRLIDNIVEQAVSWDAASLVLNLIWTPDQPELYDQCVGNICQLKPLCVHYGMPLMVEPLGMVPDKKAGGYKLDTDIGRTASLARQAVELGADIVKADLTGDFREYHRIVQAASPKPLLPRGGSRVSEKELFERTHMLMQQGVSGIVYGRNVYQHPHPERMIRACYAIVHEGATVSKALSILRGNR